MATDKLIDDDSDTYYVDGNGVMVTNTWVKVVNEDQDDEDDPAEYNYYYMQSSGKAYKASQNTTSTRFKTIDGKRYAFDEDGKMLWGWVSDSELKNDEDGWTDAVYYMGGWEDGSMKTGWQKITVYDETLDDDMDYWFYFKSNGKKTYFNAADAKGNETILEKKINSKTYGFNANGVMVYEWTVATGANLSSTSTWKYFRSPEDGARVTKGWFKVVPPTEDNTFGTEDFLGSFADDDSDEENEKWYYANGDGSLIQGEIKKIKGKYYGFYPESDEDHGAAMLNGLCALEMDPADGSKIARVIAADMDSDDLDDAMDLKGDYAALAGGNTYLYYFGSDEDSDGAMKTGSVTVNLDGDSNSFFFSKTGGAEGKGRGITGIEDKKYVYKYGKKLKASSDDKYKVVYATADTASGKAKVVEINRANMRLAAADTAQTNKDGATVSYFGTLDKDYYLIGTSGSIVKNKTAARDGDDWYFYVDEYQLKMYTNNKDLSVKSNEPSLKDKDGNGLKEDWDKTSKKINSGFTGTAEDLK